MNKYDKTQTKVGKPTSQAKSTNKSDKARDLKNVPTNLHKAPQDGKKVDGQACLGKDGQCSHKSRKDCCNKMCKTCCLTSANECTPHQRDMITPTHEATTPQTTKVKQLAEKKKFNHSKPLKSVENTKHLDPANHAMSEKAQSLAGDDILVCCGQSGSCKHKAMKVCLHKMCKGCCKAALVACRPHGHNPVDGATPGNVSTKAKARQPPAGISTARASTKQMSRQREVHEKVIVPQKGGTLTVTDNPVYKSKHGGSGDEPNVCVGKSGACNHKSLRNCYNKMCKGCCKMAPLHCLPHGQQNQHSRAVELTEEMLLCSGKYGSCGHRARKDCHQKMCKSCCRSTGSLCTPHGQYETLGANVNGVISTAAKTKVDQHQSRGQSVGDKKPRGPKKCPGMEGRCTANSKKECANRMCRRCCEDGPNTCIAHDNNTDTQSHTWDIDDYHLRQIMPALHLSTIQDWSKVLESDVSFRRISFGPDFGIRDDHIMMLAEKYPDLEVLDAGSSDTGDGTWVTDPALKKLVDSCSKLKKLKLQSFIRVTDESTVYTINNLKNLEVFEVSGNDKVSGKVTDKTLKLLMDKNLVPHLLLISVTDQLAIKEATICKLRRARRGLKVIAGGSDSNTTAYALVQGMMGLPYGAGEF